MQNDCCGAGERPIPNLLNLIQDDTSRWPILEMTGRSYCPGRGMNLSQEQPVLYKRCWGSYHSWDWSHQASSGAALTSQPNKIHAVSLALTTYQCVTSGIILLYFGVLACHKGNNESGFHRNDKSTVKYVHTNAYTFRHTNTHIYADKHTHTHTQRFTTSIFTTSFKSLF